MSLNRRNFLKSAAGATAVPLVSGCQAAPPATDDALELEAQLKAAAAKPVLHLESLTSPVIIDSIVLLKKGREYMIRVRSKDGAEGLSFSNGRAPYVHPIFTQRVVPYFIGKDARDLEEHLFGVYRHSSNYKLQGLAYWSCIAWVEYAILDMLGRIANKSYGELFGGVIRKNVDFYVASGNRDTTPEEEVVFLQELLDETKARAVKFRLGGRMNRNVDASPGRSPNLIRLARKTLGDDIDLHGDSNSSYDPPQAIEIGRILEEVNAVYFEEPCPFDRLDDTRRVTEALDIPVSGGEQEYSEWRFQYAIQHRVVDIVQPDLHYYGGLIRSKRVANMAEVRNMPTTVHISGGFGFIYMLHFASFTKDIGKYQEYKRNIERYRDWFSPALEINDGALTVPQGPGVGIVDIAEVMKGAEVVG
jgi:L-alanine-DL-glutamate epimerase-like enolase superfamily enzyme